MVAGLRKQKVDFIFLETQHLTLVNCLFCNRDKPFYGEEAFNLSDVEQGTYLTPSSLTLQNIGFHSIYLRPQDIIIAYDLETVFLYSVTVGKKHHV